MFLCLCNNEREIKSFSLFVILPDHGNGCFCVLKTCSYISVRMCEGRKDMNERKQSESGSVKHKVKEKVNDFKKCYLSEEFFRDFFDNASCIVLQLQTHVD